MKKFLYAFFVIVLAVSNIYLSKRVQDLQRDLDYQDSYFYRETTKISIAIQEDIDSLASALGYQRNTLTTKLFIVPSWGNGDSLIISSKQYPIWEKKGKKEPKKSYTNYISLLHT